MVLCRVRCRAAQNHVHEDSENQLKVVDARGLTREYAVGSDTVRAISDVSLAANAGEFIALTGPSGSGKSTLLNLLGGLDRPQAGELSVLGTDMIAASDASLARLRLTTIGFVFQEFNLFRDLTLVENVALPLEGAHVKRSKARELAVDALAKVGLHGLEDRFPGQVSGGQQQRAAIARAIVGDKSLLLADEPTGSLDSATGAEIMQLLKRLSVDGATVFLSTHNPANLEYVGSVIELVDGARRAPVAAAR